MIGYDRMNYSLSRARFELASSFKMAAMFNVNLNKYRVKVKDGVTLWVRIKGKWEIRANIKPNHSFLYPKRLCNENESRKHNLSVLNFIIYTASEDSMQNAVFSLVSSFTVTKKILSCIIKFYIIFKMARKK